MPLENQLQLRLVSKFWRHSISYAWKLQIIELEISVQIWIKRISEDFDRDTIKTHQDLTQTELWINKDLARCILNAEKGDNLFSNIKEISYLQKPNHLIQKPFFATWILLGKSLPFSGVPNFGSKDDLDKIWFKLRKWLKKKDFTEDLKTLDIRNVTEESIELVKQLYSNDQYMTTAWISRESRAALSLFMWSNKIIGKASYLSRYSEFRQLHIFIKYMIK